MTIVYKNVGLEWPNGKSVFNNLNVSLEQKVYGLVGPNGIGKTTFARLLNKDLDLSSGTIDRGSEKISYFAQSEVPPDVSIAEYLMGTTVFDEPLLLSFLKDLPLEKDCSSLSGGEWARVRLVKAAASGATFVVLDEPTNHLDKEGRKAVHDFLSFFTGGVLIISHDRELLEKVDKILELSVHGLAEFSGRWSEYVVWRDRERNHLFRDLEVAKKKKTESERQRREAIEKQEKRQRQGQEKARRGGAPRIVLGGLKRAAQKTMGKLDKSTGAKLECAVEEAWEAYQRLKVDAVMFAQLPAVELPKGKLVVEARDLNFRYATSEKDLWESDLNFAFQGPVRLHIEGANGSGKSTLLQLLSGKPPKGQVRGHISLGKVEAGFLDQGYSLLSPEKSVLENVRKTSELSEVELRNLLAMFLFQGDAVSQRVSELSGGERLRAALAKVLLATPPANVLILDEPTNNLDLVNVEFLEDLLKQYQGALIVVSHDKEFIERIELGHFIDLDGYG